jgi:GxxExxY protein
MRFEEGFRADLIVAGKVLLELKSVARGTPAHKKQVQTCWFGSRSRLTVLIPFPAT